MLGNNYWKVLFGIIIGSSCWELNLEVVLGFGTRNDFGVFVFELFVGTIITNYYWELLLE